MRIHSVVFIQLAAALGLGLTAEAQPTFHAAQSIELDFIRAETVVVGITVAYEPYDARNRVSRSITLAVTEALKGETVARLTIPYADNLKSIKEWISRRKRLLLAIPPKSQTEDLKGRSYPFSIFDLDDRELALPSSQRVLLTSPEAVIATAKEAIRRHKQAKEVKTRIVPMSVPENISLHGDLVNRANGLFWNRRELEVPEE
jgi:hypothetical protein